MRHNSRRMIRADRHCVNAAGPWKTNMELGEELPAGVAWQWAEERIVSRQSSQTMTIRRATSEDALRILGCLRAAFEEYRGQYTPAAFLDTVLTPGTVQERLAQMFVFVATNDSNEVVGTIAGNAIRDGEGHLRGMAVLPSMRGRGIAAQLLSHAESELRSLKCMHITLDTTEPLERAMRFYEKRGYHRSGRVSDFFGMRLLEYHKCLATTETSKD